jgi:hypothetical protein
MKLKTYQEVSGNIVDVYTADLQEEQILLYRLGEVAPFCSLARRSLDLHKFKRAVTQSPTNIVTGTFLKLCNTALLYREAP